MIRYDYELVRNEGDVIRELKPTFAKEFDNLSCIQGPNSSGKSTLLNIFALACFAQDLNNDELLDILKQKIKSLLDTEHQQLKFFTEFESHDKRTILRSEKKDLKDETIVLTEIIDGKETIINSVQLKNKYRIIYDIPDKPLERLEGLIEEIRKQQTAVGQRITTVKEKVIYLIREIESSRDIKAIDDEIKRLENAKKELEKIASEQSEIELFYEKLNKFFMCKFFSEHKKNCKDLNIRITNLRKTLLSEKKSAQNSDINKNKLTNQIIKIQNEISILQKDISPTIIDQVSINNQHIAKLWIQTNIADVIRYDNQWKDFNSCNCLLKDEIKLLYSFEKAKTKLIIDKVDIFNKIIKILEEYRGSSFTFPKSNIEIQDFTTLLRDEVEKNNNLINKVENLKQASESLEIIQKLILEGKAAFDSLRKYQGKSQTSENPLNQDIELKDLERKYKISNERAQKLKEGLTLIEVQEERAFSTYQSLLNNNVLKEYDSYEEEKLVKSIGAIKNQIDQNKENIDKKEKLVAILEGRIADLENRKPHKYQGKNREIEKLKDTLQVLESKFTLTFPNYLKTISKASKYEGLDQNEIKYANCIGKYLARMIGKIRYIDQTYEVEKIDYIKKEIVTNSSPPKIIKYSDMGTGQSQSAYFEGLLNTVDNRKIIALFDEIAMMDETSLKPIKDRMIKLFKEDKLLVGIIVKKDDTPKVIPLIQ